MSRSCTELRRFEERIRHRNAAAPRSGISRSKASIAQLRDTFSDTRAGRSHEALDIWRRAERLFAQWRTERSRSCSTSAGGGGLTIYQFDPIASVLLLLRTPRRIRAGDFMKDSGAARTDHRLRRQHRQCVARRASPALRIFQLTPERKWWKGEPLNLYLFFKSTPKPFPSATLRVLNYYYWFPPC